MPLSRILRSLVPRTETTGAIRDPDARLSKICDLYRDEEYILWYDCPKAEAIVILKDKASSASQLKAWAQALSVAHFHQQSKGGEKPLTEASDYNALEDTLVDLSRTFASNLQRLRSAGWDVDTAALETSSGRRILTKRNS